ncbi:uncharacterized protein LOC129758407 [Uranotaenia lowii]|uniref:uncharacterized protein LOC129758407 n=1 Tax=Uranotaenia lowii TaxID=190385 RepID=UPI00247A46C0|nr:uncharacterized protein LOC129758407 [Uranotaenia lowii]
MGEHCLRPNRKLVQVLEKVKNLAYDTGKVYDVYTGAYYHESGGEFLNVGQNAIEIPQWLWKVVIHEKRAAVVFFVLNNPKPTAAERNKQFCRTDYCREFRWDFDNSKDENGLIHCCMMDEIPVQDRPIDSDADEPLNYYIG